MSNCVCCGKELYTEGGVMYCKKCHQEMFSPTVFTASLPLELPKPNTELSFGASDGSYDFLVNYRRAKPLTKFQIWMYKVCFGIRARNL